MLGLQTAERYNFHQMKKWVLLTFVEKWSKDSNSWVIFLSPGGNSTQLGENLRAFHAKVEKRVEIPAVQLQDKPSEKHTSRLEIRMTRLWYWGSDLELGVIFFLPHWGAEEPQHLPNRRVDEHQTKTASTCFLRPDTATTLHWCFFVSRRISTTDDVSL